MQSGIKWTYQYTIMPFTNCAMKLKKQALNFSYLQPQY